MDQKNLSISPPVQQIPRHNYKKGSFWYRTGAFLIDAVILILINLGMNMIVLITKLQILQILTSVMSLVYSIFFIGSSGATPGMKLLKLRVLNTKYQTIGYGTACLRTLASLLSLFVINLGYLWVLIDRKRQTWHDKMASTYVVQLDANGKLIPTTTEEQITTGQKVLFVFMAFFFPGIGVLAILLAITLIAINPIKQFSQANNMKRQSDENAILNAISKYKESHNGQIPQEIMNTTEEISSQGINLCPELLPTYITALPVDPLVNSGHAVSDCQIPYDTGYTISFDAQGRITINAPKSELHSSITVTR